MVKHIYTIIFFLSVLTSTRTDAQIISTIAGKGQDTTDGIPAMNALFSGLASIRTGPKGNIFLIDHNRIRMIDTATGIITTVAGTGKVGFSGDGGPALLASFNYPVDFCIDNQGNIYICDTKNNRIRKVNAITHIITTLAGNGTNVYKDSVSSLSTGFPQPTSIASDNNGNVYIACSDYNAFPWYSGHNYIYKLNLSSGIITKIAGNGTGIYTGDGATALQTGFITTGICADAAGNIYLADEAQNCILKLISSTGIIHTIAGTGKVNGIGSSGDGGLAVNAKLNSPVNICFDADSNLLVADCGSNLIRKINMHTGIINTVAGLKPGVIGYSGNGGPATCARIRLYNGYFLLTGLAADKAGDFYFVDQANGVLRKVDHSAIVAKDPNVQITASTINICPWQQVILKSTIKNAGDTVFNTPSYQWIKNGVPVWKDSPAYVSTTFRDQDSIYCRVQTTNNLCFPVTVNSNQVVFSTNPSVNPQAEIAASDTAVCPGTPVKFNVTLAGGDGTSYQWQKNGVNIAAYNDSYLDTLVMSGDKISCIVTAKVRGCPVLNIPSDTIGLSVMKVPDVTLLPDDTTIYAGSSIQLQATTTSDLAFYQWSPFSGLNDPDLLDPVATPEQATEYYFTVEGPDGCSVTKSLFISLALPRLYMPTAFTPNGDGMNDIFRIPPDTPIRLKRFSIYNRWGVRIFTTQNVSAGWDGTYEGVKAPMGAYVYIIIGKMNKKPVVSKGTVLLIR